jgi:hypothetical protein
LIDLFQKVAVSKDGVFGRAPQSAKSPWRFFFANFFLCADGVKEKSGRTEMGSFTGCNGFLELSTDGK